MKSNKERAYFAAGCFWGVEDFFQKVDGVIETRVGFSGGEVENPTYEKVCRGSTNHAETVEVIFNSQKVSYEELVRIFFAIHNPTTLNKQGFDIGTQYRSALFCMNENQKEVAQNVKESLQVEGVYEHIVTEIELFENFYPAEEYHQKYLQKKRAAE